MIDYALGRLSFFDESLQFLSSALLDIPNPLHFCPNESGLWIPRATGQAGTPQTTAVGRDGRRIAAAAPLPPEDEPFGGVQLYAVDPASALLLPSPRPGLWTRVEGDRAVELGTLLFPDLEPPGPFYEASPGVMARREANGEPSGIAALPDGRVIVSWYAVVDPEASRPIERFRYHLALFSRDGDYLGPVEPPPGFLLFGGPLYALSVTGHIFLLTIEPYPAVVEFALSAVDS